MEMRKLAMLLQANAQPEAEVAEAQQQGKTLNQAQAQFSNASIQQNRTKEMQSQNVSNSNL